MYLYPSLEEQRLRDDASNTQSDLRNVEKELRLVREELEDTKAERDGLLMYISNLV